MDQTTFAVIAAAAVVALVIAWRFDVIKLSGKKGDVSGSLEAERRGAAQPSAPPTGAVRAGNAQGAYIDTDVSGPVEGGAGSVAADDASGAKIRTSVKVEKP